MHTKPDDHIQPLGQPEDEHIPRKDSTSSSSSGSVAEDDEAMPLKELKENVTVVTKDDSTGDNIPITILDDADKEDVKKVSISSDKGIMEKFSGLFKREPGSTSSSSSSSSESDDDGAPRKKYSEKENEKPDSDKDEIYANTTDVPGYPENNEVIIDLYD